MKEEDQGSWRLVSQSVRILLYHIILFNCLLKMHCQIPGVRKGRIGAITYKETHLEALVIEEQAYWTHPQLMSRNNLVI